MTWDTSLMTFDASEPTWDSSSWVIASSEVAKIYPTVNRAIGDERTITFNWPTASETITATRSINGGTFGAANVSPVFLDTYDGVHLYTIAYHADDRPEAEGTVLYRLTDGDVVRLLPVSVVSAASGGGSSLTGPNEIVVTVTDSTTDEPIEAASVRFYRTGETGTQATDDEGETTFGLATATWSWIATAAGYSSQTGTLAVSADGTLAIALVATTVTVPDDPTLSTLIVKCLDETGAAEVGAIVYLQLVGIPTGSTGLSFDGLTQEATSIEDGIATLTIVKLAKYRIRRGGSQQWKEFTAGSGDSQTIVSFIGVDPVVS